MTRTILRVNNNILNNLYFWQLLRSNYKFFFLKLQTGPIDLWWTGGSDNGQEGIWRWNFSGRYFNDNYNSWQAGEPDGGIRENCLLTSLSGNWQDEPCANSYYYVCERQLGFWQPCYQHLGSGFSFCLFQFYN